VFGPNKLRTGDVWHETLKSEFRTRQMGPRVRYFHEKAGRCQELNFICARHGRTFGADQGEAQQQRQDRACHFLI